MACPAVHCTVGGLRAVHRRVVLQSGNTAVTLANGATGANVACFWHSARCASSE